MPNAVFHFLKLLFFLSMGVSATAAVFHDDKHGNLKKLTEVTPAGTYELEFPSHDERNRIRTFIDARNDTFGYRHDGAGNLIELIYPNARGRIYYTYDSHNRLETVTDWLNRITRYHYDLNGRIARVERHNGTVRRFAWDEAEQMRGVSEIDSAGQAIWYAVNSHDDAGRRDKETVFPTLHAFTAPAFSAIYDDDNRFASFNGNSVTHDDDGNMTIGFLNGNSSAAFIYDSSGAGTLGPRTKRAVAQASAVAQSFAMPTSHSPSPARISPPSSK